MSGRVRRRRALHRHSRALTCSEISRTFDREVPSCRTVPLGGESCSWKGYVPEGLDLLILLLKLLDIMYHMCMISIITLKESLEYLKYVVSNAEIDTTTHAQEIIMDRQSDCRDHGMI